MRVVFADAGYFIAILDDRDELYERTAEVVAALVLNETATTEMVLVEVLNHTSRAGEHYRRLAARLVRRLRDDPGVEVVPQTTRQFEAAFERFDARPDQNWSLTDCASFLLMEERGMRDALANDRDFEQAGFVALLREERA